MFNKQKQGDWEIFTMVLAPKHFGGNNDILDWALGSSQPPQQNQQMQMQMHMQHQQPPQYQMQQQQQQFGMQVRFLSLYTIPHISRYLMRSSSLTVCSNSNLMACSSSTSRLLPRCSSTRPRCSSIRRRFQDKSQNPARARPLESFASMTISFLSAKRIRKI